MVRGTLDPILTRHSRLSFYSLGGEFCAGAQVPADTSGPSWDLEIDPGGTIVRSFGNINAPGFGLQNTSQGLNGPYDAKVIGDFTGLTPPTPGK